MDGIQDRLAKYNKERSKKMTAKFRGTLKAANNYREDADVMIYFQEFPINPTSTR